MGERSTAGTSNRKEGICAARKSRVPSPRRLCLVPAAGGTVRLWEFQMAAWLCPHVGRLHP